MIIYGVDTDQEQKVPVSIKDELIDNDLIHNDGQKWRFFEANLSLIKERLKLKV